MTSKQLYIIAGANGVGKTTFASQFIPNKEIPFIFVGTFQKRFKMKREKIIEKLNKELDFLVFAEN